MSILRTLRARAFVLALLCIGLGVVCSLPPPVVHTAQAPYAPFGRYRTFTFEGSEGPPEGYTSTSRSIEEERSMRSLIGAALSQKGYAEVPEGGDFLVAYGAGSRTATGTRKLSRTGVAVMGENEQERTFLEGILVVDVYDRITSSTVWHGTATDEISSSGFDEARLAEAVRSMMASFPEVWHPSAARPPASPRAEL